MTFDLWLAIGHYLFGVFVILALLVALMEASRKFDRFRDNSYLMLATGYFMLLIWAAVSALDLQVSVLHFMAISFLWLGLIFLSFGYASHRVAHPTDEETPTEKSKKEDEATPAPKPKTKSNNKDKPAWVQLLSADSPPPTDTESTEDEDGEDDTEVAETVTAEEANLDDAKGSAEELTVRPDNSVESSPVSSEASSEPDEDSSAKDAPVEKASKPEAPLKKVSKKKLLAEPEAADLSYLSSSTRRRYKAKLKDEPEVEPEKPEDAVVVEPETPEDLADEESEETVAPVVTPEPTSKTKAKTNTAAPKDVKKATTKPDKSEKREELIEELFPIEKAPQADAENDDMLPGEQGTEVKNGD